MKFKWITLMVCAAVAASIFLTGVVPGADTQRSVGPASEKDPSPQDSKCLKIGVCSVRKILPECKRYAKYRQEMLAESDKMEAELKKLSAEIDLDKQGLRSLKQRSADYSQAMKEILEKRGKFQAQQEYYKQAMEMRENQVIENLFNDVVKATAEIAKEKGLDLVLERSEPDLASASATELTLAISTHKVLYAGSSCEDITAQVLAKVDANSP